MVVDILRVVLDGREILNAIRPSFHGQTFPEALGQGERCYCSFPINVVIYFLVLKLHFTHINVNSTPQKGTEALAQAHSLEEDKVICTFELSLNFLLYTLPRTTMDWFNLNWIEQVVLSLGQKMNDPEGTAFLQ